ncbi:MAG TPA: adenosylcobinamide-GDP ribazoletransferase [Methanocorpusculum sp.]|nr:adenosylcobinamide-GDP ribazoletransferase [Methanocorpusculum sp.]
MAALKALLQFTTILPLGKTTDFDAFAKNSWMYPIAGYVTGILAAVPAIVASILNFENSMIVAALTIAVALVISGGNHFDGLLDFGDGVMAHGNREKRIVAMKDRTTGTGALVAGMTTILLTFAALASMPVAAIAPAILIAEVCGKMAMGLSSALGKPFADGIQKYIYDKSKRWFSIITILLVLPLFLIPCRWITLGGIIAALLTFCILLLLAKKLFGGVNGDVTGACNELSRMTVCLVIAILICVY